MNDPWCRCAEPLLDGDVDTDGDGDWCWRCCKPVHSGEDDE